MRYHFVFLLESAGSGIYVKLSAMAYSAMILLDLRVKLQARVGAPAIITTMTRIIYDQQRVAFVIGL